MLNDKGWCRQSKAGMPFKEPVCYPMDGLVSVFSVFDNNLF